MLQINKIPRKKEPIFQGQKIPVFQDHNTQDAQLFNIIGKTSYHK